MSEVAVVKKKNVTIDTKYGGKQKHTKKSSQTIHLETLYTEWRDTLPKQ